MISKNRVLALIVLAALPASSLGDFTIVVENSAENPLPEEHRVLFDVAAAMWEEVIQGSLGSDTLSVTVSYEPLDNVGGETDVDPTSVPSYAVIRINSRLDWFVDPTPWTNEEFGAWPDGCLHGIGEVSNQYDLLYACLHELGHALGYSPANDRFGEAISGSSDPCGWFLDQGGFEIRLDSTPDGCAPTGHIDSRAHPCDVMNAPLSRGERNLITIFPALTGLQFVYDYDLPVTFLRSDYSGGESGTAAQPFDTFAEAIDGAPSRDTLIVKAGSYPVTDPVIVDRPLVIEAVLGTATIGD